MRKPAIERSFDRSIRLPRAIADVPFPSPAAASQCKATKTSHNWNSINLRTEECAPSRASPARDSDRPLARANETETLRLPVVPTDRPTPAPVVVSSRSNYEVRLDDADSTYEPNVKNFAPRPKVWKKDMYESYGAK